MKKHLYSSLLLGILLTGSFSQALAAPAGRPGPPDSPTEVQRKAAARERVAVAKKASLLKRAAVRKTNVAEKLSHAMRVMLGLEESKAVTSPAQLTRQLHRHQRQLRMHTRLAARTRRGHHA